MVCSSYYEDTLGGDPVKDLFMPRLKDLNDQKLPRFQDSTSLELVDAIDRGGTTDVDLAEEQWNSTARVAVPFREGTAPVQVVLQCLASSPKDQGTRRGSLRPADS